MRSSLKRYIKAKTWMDELLLVIIYSACFVVVISLPILSSFKSTLTHDRPLPSSFTALVLWVIALLALIGLIYAVLKTCWAVRVLIYDTIFCPVDDVACLNAIDGKIEVTSLRFRINRHNRVYVSCRLRNDQLLRGSIEADLPVSGVFFSTYSNGRWGSYDPSGDLTLWEEDALREKTCFLSHRPGTGNWWRKSQHWQNTQRGAAVLEQVSCAIKQGLQQLTGEVGLRELVCDTPHDFLYGFYFHGADFGRAQQLLSPIYVMTRDTLDWFAVPLLERPLNNEGQLNGTRIIQMQFPPFLPKHIYCCALKGTITCSQCLSADFVGPADSASDQAAAVLGGQAPPREFSSLGSECI